MTAPQRGEWLNTPAIPILMTIAEDCTHLSEAEVRQIAEASPVDVFFVVERIVNSRMTQARHEGREEMRAPVVALASEWERESNALEVGAGIGLRRRVAALRSSVILPESGAHA